MNKDRIVWYWIGSHSDYDRLVGPLPKLRSAWMRSRFDSENCRFLAYIVFLGKRRYAVIKSSEPCRD